MNTHTIDLVSAVRRLLSDEECIVWGARSELAIAAAEAALGRAFPPSYREFLRTFGGLTLPHHVGVVREFVGARIEPPRTRPRLGSAPEGSQPDLAARDVVTATLAGRDAGLPASFIVVGVGDDHREWFCLDASRQDARGEYPIRLYDRYEASADQQFYASFGDMLNEVLGFIAQALTRPLS